MIWLAFYFCVAPLTDDCQNLAKRHTDGFEYRTEATCVEWAKGLTRVVYNKYDYQFDYACRETQPKTKPYEPKRRD